MRKYFLLSAVALMSASNVNAATDYAEVTAKLRVNVATQIECDDDGVWDLGEFIIKKNHRYISLDVDAYEDLDYVGGDVISYTGPSVLRCRVNTGGSATVSAPEDITLKGAQGEVYVRGIDVFHDGYIYDGEDGEGEGIEITPAIIELDDNVESGEYTASFFVTLTY